MGSEPLQVISAKLNRRLRKFELLNQAGCLLPDWATSIRSSLISAHTLVDKHWQGLADSAQINIDTAAMSNLRPEDDLNITFPALDAFLLEVAARKRETSSSKFHGQSFCTALPASVLPNVKFLVESGEYNYFRLAAFEKWIEQHLASWVTSNLHCEDACGMLRRLIEKYHSNASAAYAGIPISTSIMYLTLLELWVACDTLACSMFPLLLDYHSEVCLIELQCLVLPSRAQLARLHKVERYIQNRYDAAAKKHLPSVFRDFGHSSSFAVKYFDQSKSLQDTLSQIEHVATTKRRQKCEELKNLKSQYKNLMDSYNSTICETHEVMTDYYHKYTETRHKPGCSRCATKSRADSLTIKIFEWPVSSDPPHAKATVFELEIPQDFSDWRDASRYLIMTVLGHQTSSAKKPKCTYTLDTHQGLSKLLRPQYPQRRIVPLSSIKPHTGTHRIHKKIPHLEEDDVCLKNALRYGYYDKSQRTMSDARPNCTTEIANKCMYQMPLRSKALERFMYKPPSAPDGLPPNEVIVSSTHPVYSISLVPLTIASLKLTVRYGYLGLLESYSESSN